MIFLSFVLTLSAIAVVLMLITQIIVPFRNGTRYFPLFRASTPVTERIDSLSEELLSLAEQEQAQRLVEEINRRKANLEKKETNE